MHWHGKGMGILMDGIERLLVLLVVVAVLTGQALLSMGSSFLPGAPVPVGQALAAAAGHGAGEHPVSVSAPTGQETSAAGCVLPSLACDCESCRSYFRAHFTALPAVSTPAVLQEWPQLPQSVSLPVVEVNPAPPVPPPR